MCVSYPQDIVLNRNNKQRVWWWSCHYFLLFYLLSEFWILLKIMNAAIVLAVTLTVQMWETLGPTCCQHSYMITSQGIMLQ